MKTIEKWQSPKLKKIPDGGNKLLLLHAMSKYTTIHIQQNLPISLNITASNGKLRCWILQQHVLAHVKVNLREATFNCIIPLL